MKFKNFKTYQDYIDLQKEKTMDPVRREKWIKNLRINAEIFKNTFVPYMNTFNYRDVKFGLCLGARTGEEVLALRMLGLDNCIGIDLERPIYIICPTKMGLWILSIRMYSITS